MSERRVSMTTIIDTPLTTDATSHSYSQPSITVTSHSSEHKKDNTSNGDHKPGKQSPPNGGVSFRTQTHGSKHALSKPVAQSKRNSNALKPTSATAVSSSSSSTPVARSSRPQKILHGSAASSTAQSQSKTLRTRQIGQILVSLVSCDMTLAPVEVMINAANSLSFTPMDGGISGALRRACAPVDVTGKPKRWWDDEGNEKEILKIESTHAALQPAAGGLLERGVAHIVHAVGPIWTDYKIAESTFKIVTPKIKMTAKRALTVAARTGAKSCALPAISGGIFTHYREGSDIKDREQRAARKAIVEAVFEYAKQQESSSSSSSNTLGCSLTSILICDLPKREKGAIEVFVQEWDAIIAAEPVATAPATATSSNSNSNSNSSFPDSSLDEAFANLSVTQSSTSAQNATSL